ncbi:hypothetical protein BDV95DRAFT_487858 [Massariosphaeria phaeospora]|uniref:F-box domain-containing protein n=1 Tax=Massariosphaeria phaeospora TaxID=100035 RepID=A0A7C8MB45_9PLEO|nr:hypothetical protein BDV95DRAFT_487858 [Massariosphaeria phaeospora]
MKRSRDRFEGLNGKTSTTDILKNREAVALLLYRTETPDPTANDIWPNFRNAAKLPVTYTNLDENYQAPKETRTKRRFGKTSKSNVAFPKVQGFRRGRPEWRLPVELFEEVAGYLNRDDIKSMRLVSQELNSYVSQVIFKTVVVPFNTEIYGMLGQDPKPDLKGKKKVKIGTPGFFWKNSNGDDVYNGHGLDVFKGFGQHILKFGMSFEVSEDALSKPLLKSVTEQHTSFWGSYHWPFEDYRRFDDVAGLECAADETPRMKLAFSELSKVTELALSVDSGLGWLNGPDQSIRARVLQKPPVVFGTLKQIPDRRSQAQKELWDYIQSCHQAADVDVKLAMLYKMEAHKSLLDSLDANMPAREQPSMPFLDPQLVNEAALLHAADIQLPTASEEADVLESSFLAPAGSSTGILFSSATQPTITERFIYPITPTNLTQAQEEWLLETEWAQRAFLSSYMLAIIDNPTTFHRVHTLNIARLSDRYIPTLSRADFWNALPSLRAVTLLVLPGWRTVHKSEAGFVNTQKIDPASGIDSVYEMLKNIVSHRQNIKKLTLGWAHGGEHAQGFFARNKLLLPAPIMVADKAVEHRPKIISQSMLRFSHVEELTLKNCWVTPSALLQLVTEHDSLSLEKLVLDSVSLTAPLTPGPPHANAPPINPAPNNQMAPFGGNAPGPQNQANPMQLLHFHIQALQLQIQQLQITGGGQQGQLAMLQAQLQNQLQLQAQLQNQVPLHLQLQQHAPAQLPHQPPNQAQNNAPVQYVGGMWVPHHPFPVPAMPAVAVAATPDPRSTLMGKPRPGSWVNILDIVSPGPNLADFGSEFSQAIEERNTSLQAIEFISCGYAKLPNTTFDQTAIERQVPSPRNTAMIKRMLTLTPAMLSSKWPLMGEIVQEVNMEELLALQAGWHMEMGWKNAEEAQAVEFDAQLPGGTGRFSGVVRASDRVTEASASQ